eukprot:1773573-Alexandrium_andersonii.AAC.1
MSASLVGSEMCIRDRCCPMHQRTPPAQHPHVRMPRAKRTELGRIARLGADAARTVAANAAA